MLLYDELYKSESFTDVSMRKYLSALVESIIANFPNAESVAVESHIEDFWISAKKAQTLGIILNELTTNIMKYAFGVRGDGVISIRAALENEEITISVRDNGSGMPDSIDFDNSPGFGLMLVKELTKQLGGSVRIERDNGTGIILKFGK